MQKHAFYAPKFSAKARPLSLAIALLGLSGIATAQEFSQTVFFGDSLTDTGRLAQIGKNSPLALAFTNAQQSFTTNPDTTWAGVLAKSYGHHAAPNDGKSLTGTNHAVGGARATVNTATAPSVQTQLGSYLTLTNNKADPNALYAVWIGANDLFEASTAKTPEQTLGIIGSAAIGQATLVKQLGQAGANYILVPNLPDVGITPRNVNNPEQSVTATTATKIYNQTLYQTLSNQGIKIIPANTFALLQEAVGNKSAFGFENVTGVACQNLDKNITSLGCKQSDWKTPNANETYAFADDIHPSGRTHRILAQYYQSIIDSPNAIGRLPQYLSQNGKETNRQLSRRLNNLDNHKHSLWVDGNISNRQVDEQNKISSPNVMLGFDVSGSNKHTGAYLQYQKQDYHLSPSINADVKQIGIGLYHRHDIKQLRFNANLGLDRLDVHTDRRIAWDGESRSHQAKATGKRIYVGIQGSYGFTQGKTTYRPYLGINSQEIELDDLVENQANLSTALNFDTATQQSLQGEVGVNINYALNDKTNLLAGLGYHHEFKDNDKTIHTAVASIREYNQSFAMPVAFNKQNATTAHLGAKLNVGNTSFNVGIHAKHQNSDTDVGGFVGAQMAF